MATELALERKTVMDPYDAKLLQAKDLGKIPRARMAVCLPVLDAPENNPERGKVTALLGDLEALAKEMAKPMPINMTSEQAVALRKDFAR